MKLFKKKSFWLAIFLFYITFLFGFFHISRGIDFTDEGFYISSPFRYTLGDLPFRDELRSRLTSCSLFLAPVFHFFSKITLFQIRLLGLAISTLTYFLFFIFLIQYAPPFLVSLGCNTMLLINNYSGILSPSYNLFSSSFLLISLFVFLWSLTISKKPLQLLFASVSGMFFSIAVIAYYSLGVMIIIPLFLTITSLCFCRDKKSKKLIKHLLIFIGVFGAILLAALSALLISGLFSDFINGLSSGMAIKMGHGNVLKDKTYYFLKEIYYNFPKSLFILCLFLFSVWQAIFLFQKNKNKQLLFLINSLIVIFIFLIFPALLKTRVNFIVFIFSILIGFLAIIPRKEKAKNKMILSWEEVKKALILWGGASALIYVFSSTQGIRAGIQGIAPIFIAGMISLYLFFKKYAQKYKVKGRKNKNWKTIFTLIVFIFYMASLDYNYHFIYRDADIEELTQKFNHPKLLGIKSSPERVKALESLLSYLEKRVRPGELFLAYYDLPLLYFLTSTRPAYGTVWATSGDTLSFPTREKLLKKMTEENKAPEYAVRLLTNAGDWEIKADFNKKEFLLDSFIAANYDLEKTIYPFEIWHRKNDYKNDGKSQNIQTEENAFIKDVNEKTLFEESINIVHLPIHKFLEFSQNNLQHLRRLKPF